MKKITFLCALALSFVFTNEVIAQTLNQNASWPNVNWILTGTYTVSDAPDLSLEADPTIDANFAFDDDDAGNGSDDSIAAESPEIDLTAAFGAGETWLTVSVDYVYRKFSVEEFLRVQYYDADADEWVNWEPDSMPGNDTALIDGFCAGTPVAYSTVILNIAGFSALQQSNFRYRILFDDDPNGDAWEYGFCLNSPTITSATPPSCPDPNALAAGNMLPTTVDLSWTEIGTATSWDIELLDITGGDTVTGTPTNTGVTNPYTATGLVSGNDYEFYVRSDCGGSGTSNWVGPFAFTHTPAPSNDECANAIALTVNPDFACASVTNATIAGSTDSGVDNCGGTEDDDVWFSFVATSESHRVELLNVTGSTTDLYHAVYDGTPGCGALGAALTCSDPNQSVTPGLTIGVTYFVQVYSWTATADQDSVFDICIGTPPPAPGNDECADAVALTVNPDYGCGTVTGGTIASATDSGVDNCGGTEDDDVWFSFVATNEEHRIELLNITGGTTDLYHAIYDATPGCGALGAAILCSDPNVSNPTGLTIGVTYYVQVYSWTATAGQTSVFDICIGTPPTCLPPTALTADNETETTADLGWTENGTATLWDIEWGAPGFTLGTGNTETGVTTNPYTLSGLTTDTDYEFYVLADCGGGDLSTWAGPFAFSTLPPPPANDDCSNAIVLTPGAGFATNPVDGTVDGATADAEPNSCGLDGSGVWYSIVVPADGNITIETGPDAGTANGLFDSVIEAFTGVCGALVSIECDDDDAAGIDGYSILDLTGLNPGETIYVRVWEYNGDEFEPFAISAYNATLSTTDFESQNAFTFFPNPVKNELTLRAQNTIQNVSVLNMLGQEVLKTSPNALESKLDMNGLSQGSYIVQVTINNVTEVIRVIKD